MRTPPLAAAALSAVLGATLGASVLVAASPASADPGPPPAPAPPGSGWLNQAGTTLLNTVIKGAGGDKADKDDPDDGDSRTGAALTGAGIGVALIDSGVSPVPGLNGRGKVINGPDLSFESQAPNLRYLDTFGHGTHMAGIIAGQDPATVVAGSRFKGVAPGAHIVNVKVASADGASDVSQVIAGIDWVVAHRNDKGLNIKVLNLSYGTESAQAATLDPLAYAVEKAWEAGIVVVVAAGNDGFGANAVTMPAADPDVIAVGAADPRGTDTRTDDTVASFTNRGNASRHPDVLAAGSSVVSLRSPGSYIDRTYPTARLSTTLDPGQRFLRGSGTSQAAAVVSGSAALLLEQRPGLKPDAVKQLLMSTADPIAGGDAYAAGSGQINIARAARTKTANGFKQLNLAATGLGTLEASRGGAYVYDSVTGTPLTGEKDIFGRAWNALSWAVASGRQKSWNGGTWNGSTWTGTAWGAAVAGEQTWAPSTWTGRSWAGSQWAGRSWSGATWSGRSWSAQTWTGRSWSGRSWSAAGWTGEPWQ
ncbi:S8 family serine peptidase [Actinoplanes friuliensis]|uniref:Peptidase S8 and S53 subtilisin kexin sedolisin n=1 Tax=Actinoplanes friuliensis DSM 7358 TaxID=1246995 RepID=U5W389_9ACTN|nr:S8 family serine peptidase [Actinoplanes friuliensis]AGZ43673.1 peptidase S8 and S53 subtilisin kexin sedolisin [Actinoplanes friuliensis DSM 7358]